MRTPQNTRPSLVSLVTLTLSASALVSACERTKIYGDLTTRSAPVDEGPWEVGVCETDEECPQWACVESMCVEGRCIASRLKGAFSALTPLETPDEQPRVVGARWRALSDAPPELLALLSEPLEGEAGAPQPETHPPEGELLLRYALEGEGEGEGLEGALTWRPLESQALNSPARDLCVDEEGVLATLEGPERRALRVRSLGTERGGLEVRLSAPATRCVVREEGVWVSVSDKGVELINPELVREAEPSPRFDTPGRALDFSLGLSFVAVADGFAGVSLLMRRGLSGDDPRELSRALITPPLERETSGRVVAIDSAEGRVLSAEWGAGLRLSEVTPEEGLKELWRAHLGGEVAGVSLIDPYTALAWVKGRGILALDLSALSGPKELAILTLNEGEEGEEELVWSAWRVHTGWLAGLTESGALQVGRYVCEPNTSR